MAIETIKCRECGSADVTEFKPDSFVCGHCEAVFKRTDPNSLSVTPTFCSCGNPVTALCQVCRTAGLCAYCDLASPRRRADTVRCADESEGYVLHVSNGNYDGSFHDEGPLVMADKVISVIRTTNSDVAHVCTECVTAHAPKMLSQVGKGDLCEVPRGTKSAESICRCCRSSFCLSCLQSQNTYTRLVFSAGVNDVRNQKRGTKTFIIGPRYRFYPSKTFEINAPTTLCIQCQREMRNRISGEIDANMVDGTFKRRGSDLYYTLIPTIKGSKRAVQKACAEQIARAEQSSSQIAERWEQLVDSNTCMRDTVRVESTIQFPAYSLIVGSSNQRDSVG